MAINNYLKRCEYRLGGLKPFVYLIHKNALTVKIKANGVDVHFNHIKEITNDSGETETITPTIYKVEGALCTYSQDENYESKYRFNSNLTLVINELYQEPFFYGLKTLRTNQYYIIIEDKKGIQYLVNPELYTTLNYEYNFTDTNDAQNAVTINWYNLSNFPLLIFSEKVDTDNYLLREQCNYNLGRAFELLMYSHKDLKTNDDTVKITNMYIDDYTKLKKIKYLDETFTLTETYDGNMFRVNLSYSIPLEDNQFNWHYNLLEFKDNRYGAILRTTNDNYVVVGIENGLFPEYKIQTSEDVNTPNMINITFTQLSQYPILYTDEITQYRWIPTDQLCFGFDKYQMLTQQYSDDWGETWETTSPELKKKGEVIEYNSDDCKLSQWVDDGTYCHMEGYNYIKWFTTTEFVCENGNKYQKLRKGISQTPNGSYKLLDEYIKGDLIEENSEECSKIAIRWIDATDGYICFPVNEDLTEWREVPDVTTCVDYGSYKVIREYITNNGSIFYESGEEMVGDLIHYNDYNCGWKTLNIKDYTTPRCTSEITDSTVESQNVKLINVILSNENDSDTLTLQGKGTYQINIHPSLIYDDYKSDFYFMFSQLDTPLKFTGTTSTSTSTTSNYNQCVYYYGYEYGTWSYTINDDEEHTIQYGYLVKNNRNVTVRFVLYDTSPLKVNTKYDKREIFDVMLLNGELSMVSTGKILYLPIEYNSCDCGYVGYEWKCGNENGLETICGSAIDDYNPRFTISKVEGNWTREGNTFTSNDINDSETTVQRIYFNTNTSGIKFTIDQSSENKYDYLIIGNLDKTVTNTASTGSDYNFYNHKGKTTGTTSMTINNNSEHFIELMYRKDSSSSSGRDNVIVTIEGTNVVIGYDSTSMYEVWREYDVCTRLETGNIEYRNSQKSYDCGWITYQWREEEDNVCGNALPDNTTEVNEAPELNTDFE